MSQINNYQYDVVRHAMTRLCMCLCAYLHVWSLFVVLLCVVVHMPSAQTCAYYGDSMYVYVCVCMLVCNRVYVCVCVCMVVFMSR